MKILFLPDFVISDDIRIGEKFKAVMKSVDYTVVNFEAAFKGDFSPRSPLGTKLFYDRKYLNLLTGNHISIVSLANNHVMDYGPKGLQNTISDLSSNNISYFGAGANDAEAMKPVAVCGDGIRVHIYGASAYNTNSIPAGKTRPGVAGLSYNRIKKQLEMYSANSDSEKQYNVFFFHCGEEYVNYPEPYIRKLLLQIMNDSRLAVDLIVCCHAHTIQGYLYENDKLISFGMGNFAIPERYYEDGSIFYHEESKYGYGVLADFGKSAPAFEVVGYEISNSGRVVEILSEKENELFQSRLNQISSSIKLNDQEYYEFYRNLRKNQRIIRWNCNSELINQIGMRIQIKTHHLYMHCYRIGGKVKRHLLQR